MKVLPLLRPLKASADLTWFRRVNWVWWLQRLPMFLLAVPASYGVGAFADVRYPFLVAVIAGAGFEAAYMGAVAFADQQLDQDTWSVGLWWVLNVGAVASSALINVLFSAGGFFAQITYEDIVHGAPLAVLNFLYALLLHRNATRTAVAERKTAEDNKYPCPRCGRGFPTPNKRNGHMRHCK
jgi:hypothetical protein